ncbi:uncharacterized protein SPSK_09775 [Sporothrix schenckii 1099-18]|uniref:Uncharacterized protein n=2 Tax=Sporothrix schenckii TaxID=29908 RepID=U7Q0C5_SPOS1|nr:uncharacterized protein SPSK_09775 [Sporothrix schenckii 1099-18]ERT00410.1 hypothetical protein HMPREF1624_03781 [Sporothrix schenckii ATCC 58251]KJR85109.1 hypothetical protein SPSK_09775 [Sporothrix schenckii 1099-18]
MHRPVFVGLALAGAAVAVEPSCTTVKCVFDDPTATPAITAYPTTLTFSSHDTVLTSSYDFAAPGGDVASAADGGNTTDYQNMVTVEAQATSPTSYPATVVQVAVTTHELVHGTAPSRVTAAPSVETHSSTWILHKPQSTDLPRHDQGLCGNCTQPATWAPAASCVAQNQTTGCVRQCAQRDGLWYCFRQDDWYEENVMGRVCWWLNPFYGTTEFKMLGTPCVDGDRHVDCAACETYG